MPASRQEGPRKRKAPPVAPATARSAASSFASARPAAPSAQPVRATSAASVAATPGPPAVAFTRGGVEATDVASVEGEVQNSLDSLKDRLFRLELRRQAGTISEEDYARERASTEQILRELVRG